MIAQCPCPACGAPIEFAVETAVESITCPGCGQSAILTLQSAPPPATPSVLPPATPAAPDPYADINERRTMLYMITFVLAVVLGIAIPAAGTEYHWPGTVIISTLLSAFSALLGGLLAILIYLKLCEIFIATREKTSPPSGAAPQ